MTRKPSKERIDDSNEELETYLHNDFNLEIYDELTEEGSAGNKGLFEPLEFFNLLYGQYEFVKANQAKPLTIVRSLNKLKLDEYQKHFLFFYLSTVRRNYVAGLKIIFAK